MFSNLILDINHKSRGYANSDEKKYYRLDKTAQI